MIDFPSSFFAILVATFIPLYAALSTALQLKRHATHLLAYGLGISLWFFLDLMGAASFLDINKGFSGEVGQIGLISVFLFGLLITLLMGGRGFVDQALRGEAKSLFAVPFTIALTWIGVHGFAEGASVGSLTSTTESTSLIDAMGGYGGGISFVLHKFLEGIAVAAAYIAYGLGTEGKVRRVPRQLSLLALAAGLPTLLGVTIYYYFPLVEVGYFFAFAGGAYIYVMVMLAQPIFKQSGNQRWYLARISVLVLAGVLSMYFAGLFHSEEIGHD